MKRGGYERIYLKISPPSGKLSEIIRLINYIKSRFNNVSMRMEIDAKEGRISETEYEDKIKEALDQIGASIEEEEKT